MSRPANNFQGLWQIVRFNPWFYGAALGMLAGGVYFQPWHWFSSVPLLHASVQFGFGLACWWTLASLAVSHWVYDRSDWPQGNWLRNLASHHHPKQVLNVHAGFDETTDRLKSWLPNADIETLSVFDPQRLTEKSIHRAAIYRPGAADEWKGSPESWASPQGTFDWVLFLLSAHEFRKHEERVNLLRRAREALCDEASSTVILAEHVRDLANFMAFGPGFLHFHSASSWQNAWLEAGLESVQSLHVTPFLRVWVLTSAPQS
jgi:hypothetical protein